MVRLSTELLAILTISLLGAICSLEAASTPIWPIERPTDLSSGFGDYRPGHFHYGVDIRTGGVVGAAVVAPVDGWVHRIKMSYYGYGKGLYLQGEDGYIYVLAHLSKFSRRLEKLVAEKQLQARRYYLDWYLPPDSVPVKQGEVLAFSGKTGAEAPHLHFEQRTADNRPINPLNNGFVLDDTTPPAFSRLGFQMADDRSLFDDGSRQMMLPVVPGSSAGSFYLDTVLYFNRPFSLLVDCFDQMRPGGMKQAIYQLSVYFDDELYYRVQLDTIDFDLDEQVVLEYDYPRAVDDEKRVRRLFAEPGNIFPGSRAENGSGGIFGLNDGLTGRHTGRIVGLDSFGNRSEMTFQFLYGPESCIFRLDSTETIPPNTSYFYFTPGEAAAKLGLDSVFALRNVADRWGAPSTVTTQRLKDGRFRIEAAGAGARNAVLRLVGMTTDRCVVADTIFNGHIDRGSAKIEIAHEVLDDGLLVAVEVVSRAVAKGQVHLYHQDQLLGTEPLTFFTATQYRCFIPPKASYRQIDRIGVAFWPDSMLAPIMSDPVDIRIVGMDKQEVHSIDGRLTLFTGSENFYKPHYIEIIKKKVPQRDLMRLNSDAYQILPEAIACRSEYKMTYSLPVMNPHDSLSGLCWLDEKENRWVWLENQFAEELLTAGSIGGGTFAVVYDIEPPRIEQLSFINGKTYRKPNRPVRFIISDTLSGIEDDRDITIRLDLEWLIPEYDPSTGICVAKPNKRMEPGRHELAIVLTDRAGNRTEQYLSFFVRKSKH